MKIKLKTNKFDATASVGMWVKCEGKKYLIATVPMPCLSNSIINKLAKKGKANCKLEIDND